MSVDLAPYSSRDGPAIRGRVGTVEYTEDCAYWSVASCLNKSGLGPVSIIWYAPLSGVLEEEPLCHKGLHVVNMYSSQASTQCNDTRKAAGKGKVVVELRRGHSAVMSP
jgi:hypothetical protein